MTCGGKTSSTSPFINVNIFSAESDFPLPVASRLRGRNENKRSEIIRFYAKICF